MRMLKLSGASLAAVLVVGGGIASASPVSASPANLSKCTTNATGTSCEKLTSSGLTVTAATGTATANATGSGHFTLTLAFSGGSHKYASPTFSYVKGKTVTWTKKCPGAPCTVPDEATFSMVFIPTPANSAANAPNKIAVT
jgi:hypothetical protein